MTTNGDLIAVDVPGILLEVTGEGQKPGIVLLQEIFGLDASMRSIAERFRQFGYNVFVPDLFWRQEAGVELDPASAEDRLRAETLMKGLDEHLALADIAAGVRKLRGLDGATGRVAALGYCLGGRLAYLTAAGGIVDAAISYYGVGIHRSLAAARSIEVPMLLHIAGADHLCDGTAQRELYDALAFRPNFTLHTHGGAGHAFARPGGPHWNETAANVADEMTLRFLRATIGPSDGRR